ncbi:hypothetical protein Lesp01_40740 [Lentzea sp. NBRC 102530]|nr:hypothetical protein Lesp01_40740 [Lentzea sp. NBRC 102530]
MAISTAIHGNGTDSRIRASASHQTFAKITASTMHGMRRLIMMAYLRRRAASWLWYDGAAEVISTGPSWRGVFTSRPPFLHVIRAGDL